MKKTILTIVLTALVALVCNAQRQVDEFTTKNGKKVTITCIKHASMEINFDGIEIQVDPVGMWLKPETDYATFPKANIILITHEHKDHFDREAIHALRTPATSIYVNQAVFGHFKNGFVMRNGDKVQYSEDIAIEAVPAYNYTPDHQQYHPKGRDNGYILTLDGLRIYIAGDTEDIPEMADIKDIDIAFLPCNQPYTMTVEQCVNAAKTIQPKILFPYHYNDTPVHRISMQLAGTGTEVKIRNYK
ncbi:MAG: MBL fold metallo-hydrolase [Prevotella sp.]|nr:MBL fold metallo-hydrolase [Prevotella sp.]